MKRYGIRRHVALLTLVPSLVMVLALEGYFLHDRFADMDRDLLDRARLIAAQVASGSEYGVFSDNRKFLGDIARDALKHPDMRGLVILDASSETLVSAGEFSGHLKNELEEGFGNADYLGLSQFEARDRKEVSLSSPVNSDWRSLWVYHPIVPEQIALDETDNGPVAQQVGAVIVEMSKLRTEQAKSRMLWLTLAATLSFLALVLYLVHRASRSITQPVRQLSDAVHAIGEGDLTTRVALQTSIVEMDTLAQGFNRMTAELQEERAILEQRIEEATRALRQKKEEAERASHDKSRFLAVASHDLRQPLHALGMYVGELHDKVSGEEQRHLVEQVEHSIEALSTLLNALLDISKLDAGAVVPQIQNCDLKAMLERIEADYRMLASIKDIRLVIRPFPGFVLSDPMLLERILRNLVSNAVRYTWQNGSVLVGCRRRGRFLRIEVRDNGIGISPEDQKNIFREFFQLAQPKLDSNKGLGLGLSIVDRLARLLGHRLDLRSAPGKGTLFALEVPLVTQFGQSTEYVPAAPREDGEGDTSSLRGKRLLVVDDDALVVSSTSGILSSWGCEVSSAASLTEVKALLQQGGDWDLVISDYQLDSDGSGMDVIELIQQQLGRKVPCILISGDIGATVLKLASVGGHHLLHKPVRPAKLRSLVLYLLAQVGRPGSE